MATYKYLKHYAEGVLVNADSVVLASSDGTYGIKNLDTGVVVGANNTAVTNPSTGLYQYDVSNLSIGVNYRISWKVVYGSDTKYVTEDFTITDQTEPVTLADMKTHLRVDSTDDDVYIASLISTAREYAEGVQNRTYLTKTKTHHLDSWPSKDYFELPAPPLQSVTSITYKDYNGNTITWAADNYVVDPESEPGRVYLAPGKSWPSETLYPGKPITVAFKAGYGGVDDVPKKVKVAIMILVAHWYEHREAINIGNLVNEIPYGVKALLTLDRVFTF